MKSNTRFRTIFPNKKILIGVIHLPALPGFKEHIGMKSVVEKALKDLSTLQKAGFDAVLVENDGDHPPHIGPNSKISMSFEMVMKSVIQSAKIPVGLEILYDMVGTVRLAAKVNADFVRLDVFVDDGKTQYGSIIKAQAKKIVDLRNQLCPDLLLLTDIQVKHLALLGKKPLKKSTQEAVEAGSDGIIVTGNWTGEEPAYGDCLIAKKVADTVPVLVGSGLSSKNAHKFLSLADGGIVATSIKTGEYIDLKKAENLVKKSKGSGIKIACVGDISTDHYTNLNLKKPGGIAFNFAFSALNPQGKVSLLTAVGSDGAGKKLKNLLKKFNLNISHCAWLQGKTAKQKIVLQTNGERKFVGYTPGVLKYWNLSTKDLQFLSGHDAIFVPLSDGMEHVFQVVAQLKTHAVKCADFSEDSEFADFDKKDNSLTKYCKYFDINFIGAGEKEKDLVEKLSKQYPEKVFILTLGAKGSIAFKAGEKYVHPAKKTKIVDTTGCGDAFQAKFLITYLKTHDIEAALEQATSHAASVAGYIGSTKLVMKGVKE